MLNQTFPTTVGEAPVTQLHETDKNQLTYSVFLKRRCDGCDGFHLEPGPEPDVAHGATDK